MAARPKLMTPGPVEVPERVLRASASGLVSHRSGEFRLLLREVSEGLASLAGAEEALVLPGSGTTAVDAMVWSLARPGGRALVVSHGEFGRRLARTLEARGAAVRLVEPPRPGEPVDPGLVEEELSRRDYSVVGLVHTETSMGLTYRGLERVAEAAASSGARVLVDAVSAFPLEPLDLGSAPVDAVATCSHKALASPPGAAIVLLGRGGARALSGQDRLPGVPPSLDLALHLRFRRLRGETPFTPPITILYALRESLRVIGEEGLAAWRRRHRRLVEKLYSTLETGSRGALRRVPRRGYESSALAALWTAVPSQALLDAALRAGYRIAPGMGEYRGSMVRVGVMGDVAEGDVEALAEALLAAVDSHAS